MSEKRKLKTQEAEQIEAQADQVNELLEMKLQPQKLGMFERRNCRLPDRLHFIIKVYDKIAPSYLLRYHLIPIFFNKDMIKRISIVKREREVDRTNVKGIQVSGLKVVRTITHQQQYAMHNSSSTMRQGVGRPSPPCLVFLQYLAQVRSITAGIRRVASPIALDI
jgi:hypothetical protein